MNPYTIIAALALLIATALGGAHVGKKLERQAWQAKEIQTLQAHNLAIAAQLVRYDTDIQAQQTKARKASENYEKALSTLDEKHRSIVADIQRRGGLRIAAPASCRPKAAGTAESPGASGPDEEDAGTIRLPATVERDLFALAHSADKIVEQCRALQDWVRDNGHYGQTE